MFIGDRNRAQRLLHRCHGNQHTGRQVPAYLNAEAQSAIVSQVCSNQKPCSLVSFVSLWRRRSGRAPPGARRGRAQEAEVPPSCTLTGSRNCAH